MSLVFVSGNSPKDNSGHPQRATGKGFYRVGVGVNQEGVRSRQRAP